MRSKWVVEEALYALQRCEAEVWPDRGTRARPFNVRPFIIRDSQLVYAYLHDLPERAPFRDIMWVELTDIDGVSLAELAG